MDCIARAHLPRPREAPEEQPRYEPPARGEHEDARRALVASSPRIAAEAAAFVFDRDVFYRRLAEQLLAQLPIHRRIVPGHWLCQLLEATGTALSDSTPSSPAEPVREMLLAAHAPRFVAETLAQGFARNGRETALPREQLRGGVHALIPLVCPDFAICPSRPAVADAFSSPALAEQLEELATS